MINFIENSLFFGAALSLAGYEVGLLLKKKFKMALFNPLLIAILCVMGMLQLMQVDYKTYNAGGQYISCLLYTSPSPRDMRRSRMPSSA